MNANGMIRTVSCARNPKHLVTVYSDKRTLLVSLTEKKSTDPAIKAIAGRVICEVCSHALSLLDVEIVSIAPQKCIDQPCPEWVLLEKRCKKHEASHQAALAQKRLEKAVTTARLEFVAAYGLKPLAGVLIKIIADAKKAEGAKDLTNTLRFYKQASLVYKKWQEEPVGTPPASKTGMSRAERRARKFDGTMVGGHPAPVAKSLQPKLVAVTIAPDPLPEPVVKATEKDAIAAMDAYKAYEKGAESITEEIIGLYYAANAAYLSENFEAAKELWERALRELKAHVLAVLSSRMTQEQPERVAA